MTLNHKKPSDREETEAARELAKLTSRSEKEFNAEDYEIPEFEEQEVLIKEDEERERDVADTLHTS